MIHFDFTVDETEAEAIFEGIRYAQQITREVIMSLLLDVMDHPEGSNARNCIQAQIDALKKHITWLETLPPKMKNKAI